MSKSLSTQDIQRLRAYFATAEGFSLKALADNQMNQLAPPALHLAYIQSHAAVELLWNRYGRTKMLAFLKALGGGMDFETALQSVYRRNAAIIERDLVAYYR